MTLPPEIAQQAAQQAALSMIARRRIAHWLPSTPCLASKRSFEGDTALYFKAENFQRTGSFKFRGALAKLTSLPVETPVITASSGNHGIALATAARITGHQLSVVLPETVAKDKLSKIKALGVEVILHSDDSGLAERHARSLAASRGQTYVSPYNDAQIIAGQGTLALELLEQLPRIDNIFVSLGGGGLISGIGSVFKTYSPATRIIGVSARNSAALDASVKAGKTVDVMHSETLADGCAGGIDVASITVPLARAVVDDFILCSEAQIARGLRHMAWQEKLLVEGSAGLALAPWLDDPAAYAGQVSVVVLCGANFDRDTIAPVLGLSG
ncbi:MAG: threonine dehydratase [Sulfitobacter sp.]|jgi:threonine dehydratase